VGRDQLAELFAYLNFTRGVEVGTQTGLYAEVLVKANPQLHLTCVDPYLAYSGYREHKSQTKINQFREQAIERLAPYYVDFLRLTSTAASANIPNNSLDFVYIDGNHALMWVIEDLQHWVPKVRKGGIVSGHDYIRRLKAGTHACCASPQRLDRLVRG
jgi:predicted O-methyltransferase YrrM